MINLDATPEPGRLIIVRLAGAMTLALVSAGAQANLLTNGSFENINNTFVPDGNRVMDLPSGSSAIPGWTTTNGVNTAWIQNGNPYNIPASNGQFFLDLTSYFNSGTYGGVTQSFATTAGQSYTATFDLGFGGDSFAFGGPVSVTASAGNFTGNFTSASGTPNPAVWNARSFTFLAQGASTTLRIVGLSTAGGSYIGLDNVDVELTAVGAVPEPETYAMLLVGLGLLGFMQRRRKQQA